PRADHLLEEERGRHPLSHEPAVQIGKGDDHGVDLARADESLELADLQISRHVRLLADDMDPRHGTSAAARSVVEHRIQRQVPTSRGVEGTRAPRMQRTDVRWCVTPRSRQRGTTAWSEAHGYTTPSDGRPGPRALGVALLVDRGPRVTGGPAAACAS